MVVFIAEGEGTKLSILAQYISYLVVSSICDGRAPKSALTHNGKIEQLPRMVVLIQKKSTIYSSDKKKNLLSLT